MPRPGRPRPGSSCPQGSTGGPRPVDGLTNAAAGELPEIAPARGVGTWQAQPAPIFPQSMHAPSSRPRGTVLD